MWIWIVVAIQVILSLAAFVGVALAVAWSRAGAQDGRETRKLVEAIFAAFQKSHGKGYPDPSGAAVVTSPQPAPVAPELAPAPVPVRSFIEPVFPPVEHRLVTLTRDDDPIHTRPTVEAPAPLPKAHAVDDRATPPDSDETRVYVRPEAEPARRTHSDRPTLLGGLRTGYTLAAPAALTGRKARPSQPPAPERASIPPGEPVPPASRTRIELGAALRRVEESIQVPKDVEDRVVRHVLGHEPTMVSAGIARRAREIAPPLPIADPVEDRYQELCSAARVKGLAVDHCDGAECWAGHGHDMGALCACSCDGCVRATSYLAQAQRDVVGPSIADDPRHRRL